jgi:hypothetical protein
MKIVVTYEPADIIRLIRQDLTLQGIAAADADIKFVKNKAVVSVEVTPEEPQALASPDSLGLPDTSVSSTTLPTPTLSVIDNTIPDMSAIQRASQQLTTQKPGKFSNTSRQLIDGESFDYPGTKTR